MIKDEMTFENIVGKRENAGYQQHIPPPPLLTESIPSFQILIPSFNPLPDDKILDMTNLKAFAEDNFSIPKMKISIFDRVENTGKRRKCWLSALSHFPTLFSKDFFLRDIKSQDCLINS